MSLISTKQAPANQQLIYFSLNFSYIQSFWINTAELFVLTLFRREGCINPEEKEQTFQFGETLWRKRAQCFWGCIMGLWPSAHCTTLSTEYVVISDLGMITSESIWGKYTFMLESLPGANWARHHTRHSLSCSTGNLPPSCRKTT